MNISKKGLKETEVGMLLTQSFDYWTFSWLWSKQWQIERSNHNTNKYLSGLFSCNCYIHLWEQVRHYLFAWHHSYLLVPIATLMVKSHPRTTSRWVHPTITLVSEFHTSHSMMTWLGGHSFSLPSQMIVVTMKI